MRKKVILSFLALLLLVGFYSKTIDFFFATIYKEEIRTLKSYLAVLLNKDEQEIRAISTSDANFLKPVLLSKLSTLNEIIDINSMKLSFVHKSKRNKKIILFIEGYFGEKKAGFSSQLIRDQSGKWLLSSFTLSDHYFFPKLENTN